MCFGATGAEIQKHRRRVKRPWSPHPREQEPQREPQQQPPPEPEPEPQEKRQREPQHPHCDAGHATASSPRRVPATGKQRWTHRQLW